MTGGHEGRRSRWPGLLIIALAGCYSGSMNYDPIDGSPPEPDDPSTEPEDSVDASCEGLPAPVTLRRLSNTEYRNSIRDLLSVEDGVGDTLPPDSIVHGFDTNAESFVMSDVHVERYRQEAERVAQLVFDDPARRDALLPCAPADSGCLEQVVRVVGRRIYRRPLEDDEVEVLLALGHSAQPASDPFAGPRLVLEGMLQSPHFLMLVEVGEPDPDEPEVLRLTGYEIAARLSFLLRATTPDDALLDAAEDGRLTTAAGVREVAEAMLAEEGALAHFLEQWLELPRLAAVERDPELHPEWSAQLRDAMREEIALLADDHARGDVDFRELLTATHGYADQALASLYEVEVDGEQLQPVSLDDQDRTGLLTRAAVLTLTARNDASMPTFRGKYVREVLLCTDLPPPPDEIPAIPPAQADVSDRERLQQHADDPVCRGCHQLLDPVGFTLDGFDAIGARRTTDSAGFAISTQGSLSGFEAMDLDGPADLGRAIADAPAFHGCVARQLFRYGFGRHEQSEDACVVDELTAAFERSDFRFEQLVLDLIASEAFTTRRVQP